jgi:exodeoxyribonuclease V alpha subunit
MPINPSPSKRLQELLKEARALREKNFPTAPVIPQHPTVTATEVLEENKGVQDSISHTQDKYGNTISLNAKQSEFVSLATTGKSAILIGAAGTGKSTSMRAVCSSLIQSGRAGLLQPEGHKHLSPNTPGIVICAYTRRATANIRRMLPPDLQPNCITIHKLLEYQPTYYEVTDPKSGKVTNTMRFEPARNRDNPLPSSISTIIFEESSMIGTDLYSQVQEALSHPVQEIFLGDIQQLPPVFGPAILGFKMLELPTVELTEVYRQALESPIIRLAHRILSGNPIPPAELPDWKVPLQLTLHPWKKRTTPLDAMNTLKLFFQSAHASHAYDPEQDIILTPYNKSENAVGTIELNRKLANFLARKRQAVTYEIIAGFNKFYYSVGDKVLYDKEDAVIVDIYPNPAYPGVKPQEPSINLDYWGHRSDFSDSSDPFAPESDDIDHILAQVATAETMGEDRVHAASHILVIKLLNSDSEVKVSKASEINSLSLGYAITIHKAQGSEWRRVFLIFHHTQAAMLSRELLYTGVTRAKDELYCICEPDTFVKGITSQRIKGNTLAEKAEYFKGRPLDS